MICFLLKATSVLGHKQRSSEPAVLPTSDEERHGHHKHLSLAADFDRKVEELDREFDKVIMFNKLPHFSNIFNFFQQLKINSEYQILTNKFELSKSGLKQFTNFVAIVYNIRAHVRTTEFFILTYNTLNQIFTFSQTPLVNSVNWELTILLY